MFGRLLVDPPKCGRINIALPIALIEEGDGQENRRLASAFVPSSERTE
jgi:hypothetical protein